MGCLEVQNVFTYILGNLCWLLPGSSAGTRVLDFPSRGPLCLTAPMCKPASSLHGIIPANVLLVKAGHMAKLSFSVGGGSQRCEYWVAWFTGIPEITFCNAGFVKPNEATDG